MLNQHDHRDVVSTIHEFCRAFDQQDWTALRRCLAANLFVDYSSFRGTLPSRITADEVVALRQTALEGLVTQHLSANHLVTFTDQGARCGFDFVIHRWPRDAADARFFHSFGYNEVVLRVAEGGPYRWVIESITQQALRSEGSPELHRSRRQYSDRNA
jgi:hypothetical protein